MHWNATDERYHEALRRLAVILLALAVLAERAACRSWPLHSLLLWLLGKAEARVCDFAVSAGAGALPVEFRVCPSGGSTAIPAKVRSGFASGIAQQQREAARLAKTFRALAAVFFALARQGPQWLRIARRHRLIGNQRNAARVARLSFASRRSYADTS